jgi:hypothetical protein
VPLRAEEDDADDAVPLADEDESVRVRDLEYLEELGLDIGVDMVGDRLRLQDD